MQESKNNRSKRDHSNRSRNDIVRQPTSSNRNIARNNDQQKEKSRSRMSHSDRSNYMHGLMISDYDNE